MSKRIGLFFYLFIFVHPLFASLVEVPYYPRALIELKESLLADQNDSETQTRFREKLIATMTKVHLQIEGQRDSLHAQCPEKRPTESKCLEQQSNISYRQAREYLFGHLHLEANNSQYFVEDQYCQEFFTQRDGVGPGRIPNHQLLNCEHTWPQSRFNSRQSIHLQKTDLHHLFPVDSRANSSRGNIPFGEVTNQSTTLCQASKRGPTKSGVIAFEPPDQHKGNVARALFYFSFRYNSPISDDEESYLRQWHQLDPVDEGERSRNEKIFAIQGNRNPFIDDHELVELIQDF